MKKKIILGIASSALILGSLTACNESKLESTNESSSDSSSSSIIDYSALARPVVTENNGVYQWIPVTDADGYVAKLDDGEPFGIGSSVAETAVANYCLYQVSTDDLKDGMHTIKFAAYKDSSVLSAWTDSFSFYVNKTVVVSTPTLQDTLKVTCNSKFDHVSYDFSGTKYEVDLNEENTSYTPDFTKLGLDKALESGKKYIVTCTVSMKGINSESSEPITFTYSASKNIKSCKPTIVNDSFVFDEQLVNPSFTFTLGTKAYIFNCNNNYRNITLNDLIEKCNITNEEKLILAGTTVKAYLQVNYDSNHYLSSDVSEGIDVTFDDSNDKEIFDKLCSKLEYTYDANSKLSLGYKEEELGVSYLSFKAYNAENDDALDEQLPTTLNADFRNVCEIDCQTAKQIKLVITYARGNQSFTYERFITIPAEEQAYVYNVVPEGSSKITWSCLGSVDAYEVEVSQGTITKTYKTFSNSISVQDIDLEGDISVLVYAIKNGSRITDSVSNSVTFKKNVVKDTYSVTSKGLSLLNNKNIFVRTNGNSQWITYQNSGSNYISLDGVTMLEVYCKGDGVNTLDSDIKVFNFVDIKNIKYTIEDNKYLVVDSNYNLNSLVDSEYGKYIVEGTTNKFDLDMYRLNESKTVLSLKGNINEISCNSINNKIDVKINVNYSKYGVNFTTASSSATSFIEFEAIDYQGKYQVLVLDENNTEVKNEIVNTTSYNLNSLAFGKYRVKVRTTGNGNILPGNYNEITYYANDNNVLESISLGIVDNYNSNTIVSTCGTQLNFYSNGLNYEYRIYKVEGQFLYNSTTSNVVLQDSNYNSIEIKATNNNSTTYYKCLPNQKITLSQVKIDPNFDSNSYYYYIYKVNNNDHILPNLIKNNVLGTCYKENNGTYKYQYEAGTISGKTFKCINVSGFDYKHLNEKCYGYQNVTEKKNPYEELNVDSIIIDSACEDVLAYLNTVSTLATQSSGNKYKWYYYNNLNEWVELTSGIGASSINSLKIDV